MIVLLDTNVVLDVLLDREPHAEPATRLFAAIEMGRIVGLLCATSITTVSYLAGRAVGARSARAQVAQLLELFNVAPVTRVVLEGALALPGFRDFEDAVVHEAARHSGATTIVTRNPRDFASAKLRVQEPRELLETLNLTAE